MTEPINPNPVVCSNCGLLVGWAHEPVRRFYCIPCFDSVPIKREAPDLKVKTPHNDRWPHD